VAHQVITATRKLTFCAAHRVLGHESKCKNLHGHNYTVMITAEALVLDDCGRVVDFSVLKDKVGGYINAYWDHGCILNQADPLLTLFAPTGTLDDHPCYALPKNPTAENMAAYIGAIIAPQVLEEHQITVTQVDVWETENCFATWRLNK
jgi:6-pyruvoyltetrahydropterin/6-carboxytetrahydropterin synthase